MCKYKLGNINFKNKKQITNYIKAYKNSHMAGHVVEEPHRSVLLDLLKWHPRSVEFLIPDFHQDIEINTDDYGGTNFKIKVEPSVWKVFSYYTCIKAQSPQNEHRSNVIKASRSAISDIVKNFKLNRIQMEDLGNVCKCAIDGNLYLVEHIHVDHDFTKITFQRLLDDYLLSKNKTYKDIKPFDTGSGWILTGNDFIEWVAYHEKHAVLRCIHKKYNLSGIKSYM
jgi:hypothetical protein